MALWDLTGDGAVRRLVGHDGAVNAVVFTPDGRAIASAGSDATVRLWNLKNDAATAVLKGHRAPVRALAVSPDGSVLASASDDETVRLWDAVTGRNLAVLGSHHGPVTSVAFSSDGKYLITGSQDRTIDVWLLAQAQAAEEHAQGARRWRGRVGRARSAHRRGLLGWLAQSLGARRQPSPQTSRPPAPMRRARSRSRRMEPPSLPPRGTACCGSGTARRSSVAGRSRAARRETLVRLQRRRNLLAQRRWNAARQGRRTGRPVPPSRHPTMRTGPRSRPPSTGSKLGGGFDGHGGPDGLDSRSASRIAAAIRRTG